MLIDVPRVISAEMMKTLMEMGHGDEIVIADGNFPAASCAKKLIKADGHNVPELLEAILKYFPLDQYVKCPICLMSANPGKEITPKIWNKYKTIIKKHNDEFNDFEFMERFDFYERAKDSFAIIATSEPALYGNIIIKKGVI